MDVWCFIERKRETRMIRWMWGVSLKESQPRTELRRHIRVEAIGDVMRRGRLRWHGHVGRKGDACCVKACVRLVLETTIPIGRPKKTWQNSLSADMRLLKVDPWDVHD